MVRRTERAYRVTATNRDGETLVDTIRVSAMAAAKLIDRMRGWKELEECTFRAEACA